jgi:hypothetical protein
MLQEVNVEALGRAAEALVGPQATAAIFAVYKLIDQAMFDGYTLGRIDAERNVEERLDAAFDNGFEEGFAEGYFTTEESISSKWDEGYLEGVGDARARPAIADETVADIISDLTQNAINGEFDIDNVTDSGDEDDYFWRMTN